MFTAGNDANQLTVVWAGAPPRRLVEFFHISRSEIFPSCS
jgi:hypothetical protein